CEYSTLTIIERRVFVRPSTVESPGPEGRGTATLRKVSLELTDHLGEVQWLLADPAARVGTATAVALVPVDRPEGEPRQVILLGEGQHRLEVRHLHRLADVGLAVHR